MTLRHNQEYADDFRIDLRNRIEDADGDVVVLLAILRMDARANDRNIASAFKLSWESFLWKTTTHHETIENELAADNAAEEIVDQNGCNGQIILLEHIASLGEYLLLRSLFFCATTHRTLSNEIAGKRPSLSSIWNGLKNYRFWILGSEGGGFDMREPVIPILLIGTERKRKSLHSYDSSILPFSVTYMMSRGNRKCEMGMEW